MPRALSEIAKDIKADWKKVYFGAVPYLQALETLEKVTDSYFCDSAESIIVYFLGNAQTYRGGRAKELKAELKALVPHIYR